MAALSTSLRYDSALFVNREAEIHSVHATIDKLVSGETVEQRTIQFEGLRGGGKSWLAFHLQRTELAQRTDVKILLFAFDVHNDEIKQKDEWHYNICMLKGGVGSDPDAFATSILRFACRGLAATDVDNASLEERSTWLVRRIRESKLGVAFVFIFDSISELDPSLIKKLEHSFLASVAELPNVLVILTGRPPQPLWTSIYLRVKVNSIFLEPLSQPMLTEALKRRYPNMGSYIESIAENAFEESKGNPGAFMRLAVTPHDEMAGELGQILDGMLSMYSRGKKRIQARRIVEALSVLMHGFRQEEIITMLDAYAQATGEVLEENESRTARNILQDGQILSWNFEKQGFVLDDSIRRMAEKYLRIDEPEIWKVLHERAAQMYEAYAAKPSKWKDVYLAIAQEHRKRIGDTAQNDSTSHLPYEIDIPSGDSISDLQSIPHMA